MKHSTAMLYTMFRKITTRILFTFALLLTAVGAKAADYVLAYVNGGTTYYLARNGTTAVQRVTTFDPTTCIWSCASNTAGTTAGTLNNSNTYGYLFQTVNGTRYFLGAPDADLALATNVPNNYYRWRTNGTYVYNRYSGTYSYYVNLANGVARNTTANTASNARPYEVTTSTVDATSTNPTINGADVLTATGNSTYTATGAAYRIGYTNYQFNNANHYFDSDGISFTGTPGAATIGTYTWNLESNSYATVNNSGVVTVSSLPQSDLTLTLTVTATATGGTPAAPAGTTLTASKEITIQGTTPSAPIINVSGSSVTLSTEAAGTTTIRYTLDGTDPTATSGTVYSGAIDLSSSTTSPVTIKAVTVRNGNASAVTTQQVTLTLPEPVITVNAEAGTATITSSVAGATIYYTLDGGTPTTSSSQYSGSLTGLTMMTTVNAIAVKDGWNNSPVASETVTIPSGTDGGTVTLFDYEPHSWSYYSDPDCPVRSLNPADVKITYYGDGIVMSNNNDYTAGTNNYVSPGDPNYVGGAKVNVGGENENTFIYYKTLERGDATQTAWTFSSGNQSSAASRCPYTPIPNPFQVRPTYGTRNVDANDFTGWRGFQCWRLKSVTGGAVYSAASGGTALAVNAIVNAETQIYFAPDSEYGMEVELEAVWARAYLIKGNQGGANNILAQNVGVERNFMTLTSGQNYRFDGTSGRYIGNKGYAVTISNYYPSGEAPDNTNSTISGYNDMTLGADTKFENVTFNSMGSYTLTAAGHDLIVGRGCSGTVANLYGATSAPSSSFNMRIESGAFAICRVFNSTNNISSAITVNTTFGSDYDRANNEDNSKLSISNMFEVGRAARCGSSSSKLNVFVLSGSFGTDSNDHEVYMGFANVGGVSYATRYLEVLGGNFVGGIAGGIEANATGISASTNVLTMRIKGGTIHRYVYGSGQYSAAYGTRTTIVTGGTFDCWVAGGAYGTENSAGNTNGNTNIYFGGDANQTSTAGIYGAGYGNYAYANGTAKYTVVQPTVVVTDEAKIAGSVFGGGNNGYATGTINVHVLGSMVAGDVYGGANMAPSQGDVAVIVKGGTVNGGVYGGSNQSGAISGQITVDVYGTDPQPASGYAINQVFGGGNVAAYSGKPIVTVHCGNNISIGEVYGGGNQAAVNATDVTIAGGNRIGYVYGGGRQANVNGNTSVKIEGGTVEHVFGGNNISGNITGTLSVNVERGSDDCLLKVGELYGGGNHAASKAGSITIGCTGVFTDNHNNLSSTNRIGYELEGIGDVYGGANEANITSGDITLNINSGMISRVFGGNNTSGSISGSIEVNINKNSKTCGWYVGSVFGGGNLATYTGSPAVNIKNGTVSGNVYGGGAGNLVDGADRGKAGKVTGNPTVTIGDSDANHTAIVLGDVYGGGDAADVAGTPVIVVNDCNTEIGYLYGGGNAADVNGTSITVNGGTIHNDAFGGGHGDKDASNPSKYADVKGDVVFNVYGGTFGRVFAGSNSKGDITGTSALTINKTGTCAMRIGEVYGGGNEAAGNAGSVTIGCTGDWTTTGTNNHTNANTTDNRIGYELEGIGTVYGGANQADIGTSSQSSNITLNINSGMVANVFGGNNTSGTIYGTIQVNINQNAQGCGWYVGNVFGGGNLAAYSGTPDVNIQNGTVSGCVYGGGNEAGVGGGDVSMTGGSVLGGIYGGCNTEGTVGGKITVNLNGGTVGSTTKTADVYGGGLGVATATSGDIDVKLNGTTVYGDLYGGSALGSVNADGASPANLTTLTIGSNTLHGTIYGGGKGSNEGSGTTAISNGNVQIDYNTANTNLTGIYGGANVNGLVKGNIIVNVLANVGATGAGNSVNVFGGGLGENTDTNGDVTVNIGDATHAPVIYGDIYGGSALGNVNSGLEDYTRVNLNAGTIHGDSYGGGLGQLADNSASPAIPAIAALVNGNVTVTQNGVTFVTGYATETNPDGTQIVNAGRIFGCNNLNGSPQGTVLVLVNKTSNAPTLGTYDMEAVYGGGNLAAYAPATATLTATGQFTSYDDKNGDPTAHVAANKPLQVVVNGCNNVSVGYVYGGGNAAPTPSTDVLILGAKEIGYVFGGGNGKDRVLKNGTWGNNPGADVGVREGTLYGTGDAYTTILGGTIHEAYGASNQKGTIKGDINLDVREGVVSCALAIDKIVGAGKNADVDGDCILVMGCMPSNPKTQAVFGGADNANVNGNVELTITSGSFGQVFGGNNLGGIIKGHIKVNIEETGCNPIVIDDLYLGGNQAAYSIFGYYEDGTLTDGRTKYSPRTSADDTHTAVANPATDATHTFPYAQPVLNVISCTSIGKVFGGGLGTGAAMYANPTVNVNMVQGQYYTALPVNENNPNKLGAVENVYGGGNEAAVYGSTRVNIGTEIGNPIAMESSTATPNVLGAYITGTVYGAGKGVETDPDAAIVTGNTQVNMAGGHISRSIYGGGELGSVGTFTETYTTQELHPYHAVGEPKTCKEGTGLTEVKISGGQVGLVRQLMPDPSNPTSDDDYGYVFCACKGVSDSVTYAKANLLAICGSSHLVISDNALIAASVYGGSENGQVLGDTYVEIKGGQIGTGHYKDGSNVDHWDPAYTDAQWTAAINAIKSGVVGDINTAVAPFHECDAWPFGSEGNRHVYDYFHGTAGYDSKGAGNPGSDGHSYYGHVFGGGSGYYPFAAGKWRRTAGRVNGNTVVEISGGHVLTNVYGGNEITDVLGSSKVEMWGGTVGVPRTIPGIQARPVNSYIFGAGMGDPRVLFNGWSNVGSAEVIVRGDAVVFGSVFGGGEDGHVLGDVSTTIKGDALIGTFGSSGVDGNIFGSGRGFSALALTAGAVCGDVTVNIAERAKILGSIFGGGRMAAVGTYLVLETDANYGKLIAEGQDPYGTGSTTHGNVTVNITGGTIGNQSQLSTSAYSIGDVFGGSKGTLMSDWAKTQKLGLVKNTTVNISQAAGSTTTIYGNVYGGGELASVGSYNYATPAEASTYSTSHPSEPMTEGDVLSVLESGTGKATILITGGTIGQNTTTDTKGNVFGGCLGKAGTAFSGYSFVNNSDVTLQGGTVYGSIFGGGENGHVFSDTDVKIKSGSVGIALDKTSLPDANLNNNMIYRGNVYGGGRGIDKTTGDTYSITAGKVNGDTNVTVEGGIIYRNVYGGGSLASVGILDVEDNTNGNATVTIKGGQIGTDGGASANNYNTLIPDRESRRENGFVFGSGRGMAAGNTNPELARLAYTKNTIVSIEGTANVTGSVFGGGENGHVKYDTKVYVKENSFVGTELIDAEHAEDENGRGRLLYRGNVYGGGRGIDTGDAGYSLTAGRVYGDTFVEVSGGKIYHDVFGGGSLASVGNETVNPTTGEVTYGDTSGETEVHIKGGIIGYSSTASKQGFNCGFVYGGCRGLSAPSGSDIVKMAYVHDTKVYIEPGADVKGSVFGGGANGHVKNDTYVEISGGSIGTALLSDEVGFDEHGVAAKPVFRGNVYAGGRGVDQYYTSGSSTSEAKYSLSAGAVYGNAELLMTGGQVWHNIYGSGAMASVGTVKAKAAGQHVHDEVVDGSGNLVNNVIYNPDESDINYLTGVFKEGTGKVTVTITGGTVGDTTAGHEGINNGNVYGAGRGVSADRSDYVASMEYVNETDVTIGTSGQQPSSYTGSTPDALNYPYIYGAVFGGGENGHVKTDTDVKIYSGIIGFPLVEGSSQEYKTAADGSSKNPYRGNVFGAGRGVDPVHHSTSEQRSSSAGRVYGHTNVTMTGGVVRRAIYGGGLLASVGVYRLNKDDDMHIIDMIEDEVDAGDATVTISGGYIGNVNPDGTALSGTNASGIAYLVPGDNNGHVFGSSCGMVADDYEDPTTHQPVDVQYRQMGYSHSTHVSISGNDTRVFGSVFGSGENGHVWEDTRIDISGGEIGYQPNSSTFIYAGNVYGSGRGVDHPHSPTGISETAGKVRGNTTVNLTGGIVWRDVYGGGSLASVGEADEAANDSKKNITTNPTTNNPFPYSTGLTRVVIDGTSAVHGSVYGSGRGVASTDAVYKQAAYVKNTLVTVKGSAHVFQNVFGGGNAGHVRKNTDVTIDGSSKVDGNVYGGGAGDISSPTAGLVNHDVAVNIKGGLIAHDVYGGGAIANSNVHDVRNTAVTECTDTNRGNAKTLVNLTGGIILGDAYGGGQGVIPGSGATAAEIANAAALVQGDVTLTLDGTAFYPTKSGGVATSGRVFGCNNLNGTPQGTVFVQVLQTKGVTESGGTYSVNDTKPTLDTDTYEVQAVYGGGNLAAYEPWNAAATGQYTTGVVAASNPLQVLIDGCDKTSIEYVYGGGNAASAPSTQVIVRGAYELGTVFGGGNGKDALPNGDPNPGAHVGFLADGTTPYSSGSGNANVYLYGGYIHNAFGASNTLGNIAGKAEVHIDEAKEAGVAVCPLILDEVYGGGNEAYMAGGTDIDMGCITYLKAIYGGAKNADVGGDINLTITSGHFDRVFGGNNIGGVINGAITVNIEETGCNPITIGELYGCGNQARYTTPGNQHPTINVKSFTSIGRIFGGGLGASAVVRGNPTVNINEVVGEKASFSPWNYPGTTINYDDGTSVTLPTHTAGEIGAIGTVFGGGNAARVEGDTNVYIGTLETISYTTDAVGTNRTVVGVKILDNVFGGGNKADVTGSTNVVIGREATTTP